MGAPAPLGGDHLVDGACALANDEVGFRPLRGDQLGRHTASMLRHRAARLGGTMLALNPGQRDRAPDISLESMGRAAETLLVRL